MITVCKDCPKRHPKCHGVCEWYKAERRALDAENKAKRIENTIGMSCSTNWNFNRKKR